MPEFASTFTNIYFANYDNAQTIAQREQPLLSYYSWKSHGGRAVSKRFLLAGPRGTSGTLAGAQSNSAQTKNSDHYEWVVPPGEYFGSIRIPHKDIAQSETNEDAAARALQLEMDMGTADFAQQIVRLLLGGAGASLGTAVWDVDAGSGFPIFTLRFTEPANACKLQLGDQVNISLNDGTDSSHVIVGSAGFVVGKDDELGYVQIANPANDYVTPAAPAGWVDNTTYNVFRLGEFNAGVPTSKIISWQAYVTTAKATSALAGLTAAQRNANGALSGARLPANSYAASADLATRAKALIAFMRGRYGKKKSTLVVLHPEDWDLWDNQLDTKTRREPGKSATSGYQTMTFNSANGSTEVVSEPEQPKGTGLLLDPTQLELHSNNGKIYQIINEHGSSLRLFESSNDFEVRPVAYLSHVIGEPYAHGRFSTT